MVSFLNEQVLFWTFSTIAQALAALIALSAMVAFYVLRRSSAAVAAVGEQLVRWAEYGYPGLMAEEKGLLISTTERGLWTLAQIRTAVDFLHRNVALSYAKAKYEGMLQHVDRELSRILVVQKYIRVWVSWGAAAICLSLLSLPFVSLMAKTKVSKWVSMVWILLVVLVAVATVVGVAGQFLAWMGYDGESGKKRKPKKRTTAEKKIEDRER
ncbi:hypothetical protein E3J62_00375 [candidate division TA06 bacterium]|uniref:Uncharacterized protein n=1 Tax=candidate division TA06 bacterium TaxID=2250710 RepID=A0A523UZ41_UNCT6|nr:MAG: hypothetical protein E3J62_00375 [candidate division TA06 bacterium]